MTYSSSYHRISDDSVSGFYGHTDLRDALKEAEANALSDDISYSWVRDMDTNAILWDSRPPRGSDTQVYCCKDCCAYDPDTHGQRLFYEIRVPGERINGMQVVQDVVLCERHSPI